MVQKIINHIVAAVNVPVREYDEYKNMIRYNGDGAKEDVLFHDAEFLDILSSCAEENVPMIYQEMYPIYYGVIRAKGKIYIMGPVNIDFTVTTIQQQPIGRYYAGLHHLPEDKYRISFCEHKNFCEEYLLLFNCLADTDYTYSELCMWFVAKEEVRHNVRAERSRVYFQYQENEKVHNSYDHERREMNSIREGNVEKLKMTLKEVVEGEYAVLSKDSLRSMKNLEIVALAIVARAAIDGGMNPEEAFSINDSYILRVDAAATIEQIGALDYEAKVEYATLVHNLKEHRKENTLVEEAKRIIFRDMHKKIIIKDVAGEIHITPEYLSALFKRAEGITVNDYIMREKVRLSENLLMYSRYSMREISYYFGFCSQSHYGKVFKKWKNMTPGQYRSKYGVREFMED